MTYRGDDDSADMVFGGRFREDYWLREWRGELEAGAKPWDKPDIFRRVRLPFDRTGHIVVWWSTDYEKPPGEKYSSAVELLIRPDAAGQKMLIHATDFYFDQDHYEECLRDHGDDDDPRRYEYCLPWMANSTTFSVSTFKRLLMEQIRTPADHARFRVARLEDLVRWVPGLLIAYTHNNNNPNIEYLARLPDYWNE
jgi:hypothetical protein